MRRLRLVLFVALAACRSDGSGSIPSDAAVADAVGADGGAPTCALFGRPNEETGLTGDQCGPACACNGTTFAPPVYDDTFIRSLVEDWVLSSPFSPLESDPYAEAPQADDPPETVCAVLPGSTGSAPRPYTLVTYSSADEARAASASVTHFGHCGVCSTLANLAVYMSNNDLTAPVRACGFRMGTDGGTDFDADVACLEELGFDLPCAQAWAYDTQHTRSVCLSICLETLSDPYNLPDGSLNPCIQCDEDQSGPVFRAIAGRTRRNSGLPNAICRPCSDVRPLLHAY
jgi:hypothetical protein